MTKLLVGMGLREDFVTTDTIEIIDLKSPSTNCESLTKFPLAFRGSFGGLGFHDKPMICGGKDKDNKVSKKCLSLEGHEWTSSLSLNTPRYKASVLQYIYSSKLQYFFVYYLLFLAYLIYFL